MRLLLLLLWNESHVTVESFEWSNFSIIHNHQCINFTLLVFYVHSVIKKHISFMQKKVSSENSNETSRSREAYKHNINSHVRITHPVSSTVLHFVAIFLLGLNHHVFHRFAFFIHSHPQQSNESKKSSTVIDLKAFSHYVMKAHMTRQTKWKQHQRGLFMMMAEWNLALCGEHKTDFTTIKMCNQAWAMFSWKLIHLVI